MPANLEPFGTVTFDEIALTSNTASTSTTTGALRVAGGIGVVGDVHIGGTITGGAVTYASTSSGTFAVTDTTGTTLTVASTENSVSLTTGAVIIEGGVSVKQNLRVGGTLTAGTVTYATTSTGTMDVTDGSGSTLTVASTTNSTSSSTGAVVVQGGVGIGQDMYVNGLLRVASTQQSTTTTTGSIVASGGIGANGNVRINGVFYGNGIYVFNGSWSSNGNDIFLNANASNLNFRPTIASGNGQMRITLSQVEYYSNAAAIVFRISNSTGAITGKSLTLENTTATTSPTTGTLTTPGGISSSNTTDAVNADNGGSATLAGGLAVKKKMFVGGIASFTDPTAASISAGAIVVTGGINTGSLYVTGQATAFNLITTDTTNATSTVTGSLTTAGGIGCAKTVYADSLVSNTTVQSAGNITNGGFDFVLGNSDQATRGNSGLSRALIKDAGNILVVNHAADFAGGTNVQSSLTVDNNLVVSSTGESTSTASGAIVTLGGIGCAKTLSCNNLAVDTNGTITGNVTADTLTITSVTGSTSTTTGAVTVAGGIGCAKSIFCNALTSNTFIQAAGNITNGGFEFILGNTDQVTRGDTLQSRALVKETGQLVMNFGNDFGAVQVQSDLSATGDFSANNFTAPQVYPLQHTRLYGGAEYLGARNVSVSTIQEYTVVDAYFEIALLYTDRYDGYQFELYFDTNYPLMFTDAQYGIHDMRHGTADLRVASVYSVLEATLRQEDLGGGNYRYWIQQHSKGTISPYRNNPVPIWPYPEEKPSYFIITYNFRFPKQSLYNSLNNAVIPTAPTPGGAPEPLITPTPLPLAPVGKVFDGLVPIDYVNGVLLDGWAFVTDIWNGLIKFFQV